MAIIERFMREQHECIENFKAQMGAWLYEAQIPDLSSLYKEFSTLRSEEFFIVESHISVIPPVIPYFMQPLPKPPPQLIFDIFTKNDMAYTVRAKRGRELEE